jgi:hypothetical protein
MNELIAIIILLLSLGLPLPAGPAGVLVAPAATPPSGPSPTPVGTDLSCNDFATQVEAQHVLEADRGDPYGLDVDLDGVACETPMDFPSDGLANARDDRPGRQRARAAEGDAATPVPVAGEDLDCIDFAFQDDAQAVYDRIPGDPYNLDPSGDGVACSSLPSRGGG